MDVQNDAKARLPEVSRRKLFAALPASAIAFTQEAMDGRAEDAALAALTGILDITQAPYNCRSYIPTDPITHDNMGDGTTWGFRKAVADAVSQSRVLYIPPGTFHLAFTAAVHAIRLNGSLTMIGAGRTLARLHPYADDPSLSFNLFESTASLAALEIRDVSIEGPSTPQLSTKESVAVYMPGVATPQMLRMTRVTISGKLTYGLFIASYGATGSLTADLEDLDITAQLICIAFYAGNLATKRLHLRNSRLADTVSHLIYVHPHVALDIVGTRFENTSNWGIKHYSATGQQTLVPEYIRISDCSFTDLGRAILTSDLGHVIVSNCTFRRCGAGVQLRIPGTISGCRFAPVGQWGSGIMAYRALKRDATVRITGCHFTFAESGNASPNGITIRGEGDWLISDCTFHTAGSRALVSGIVSAGGSPSVGVDNCSSAFLDGGDIGCGSVATVSHGRWRFSNCRFYGDFKHNRGGINVEDQGLNELRIVDTDIHAFRGYSIWMESGDGKVMGWDNSLSLPFTSPGVHGRMRMREQVSATVLASAPSLVVPHTSSDTFHVSGTAVINRITIQDESAQRLFAGSRLRLIADDGWSIGSDGNVVAAAGVRSRHSIVELFLDPVTMKWLEVGGAPGR